MIIKVIFKRLNYIATCRFRNLIVYSLMIISTLALLPSLEEDSQGDVLLYQNVAQDLNAGVLPYRDRVLEYPPYVIPIILLPHLFEKVGVTYSMAFKYQILIVDWLLKLALFFIGLKQANKSRSFLPLFCYCLAIPFLHFFFLQRYDIWPAFICLIGIWLFNSGKYALSGFCFAAGIGVKIYPIVFLPPLFILAWHQGKSRQFVVGILIGLIPILLLSFALPWWRFAEFHAARGLQCESLYASLIWLAKRLGFAQAKWVYTKSWFDVQGSLASAVLPWARFLFVGAVAFSTGFATWISACSSKLSIGRVARLLLIPLLGFVAFNQVLSPQYMIWILPIAGLGLLEGKVTPIIILILATMVTHIIFPSFNGDYSSGLNLWETSVMVLRNLTLVIAWVLLVWEQFPIIRRTGWAPMLQLTKGYYKYSGNVSR